ncbi:MAG: hypothetical protein Q4D06_02220 [Coriobacteriia bacterium]|nr:hypothetical protein [Coriobacteriia bacterium]
MKKKFGLVPALQKSGLLMAALCLSAAALLGASGCTSQPTDQPKDEPKAEQQDPAKEDKGADVNAPSEDDGSAAAKGDAKSFVKELTLDHTYKKYDVTGDGHPDRLLLESDGTDEAFTSLKVLVNDKVVLVKKAQKDDPWYSVIANLVMTSNGKALLDLECVNGFDIDVVNALYLLGENELKPAIDYTKLFDPSCGMRPFANVHSVKGNELTVRANLASFLLGSGFSCEFTYVVNDDGSVSQANQTATNIQYSTIPEFEMPADGFLKTTEELQGTRELGGAKVVRIAAGHLLKPVAAQVLNGVLYVEFQMEDGTSFWISKTGSASTPEELAEVTLPFEGLM